MQLLCYTTTLCQQLLIKQLNQKNMFTSIKKYVTACCIMAVCNTAKAQTVNVNSGYNSNFNLILNGNFENKGDGWVLPITSAASAASNMFIDGQVQITKLIKQ
jgi:hypothetical protein